jgi:hypothetical protein
MLSTVTLPIHHYLSGENTYQKEHENMRDCMSYTQVQSVDSSYNTAIFNVIEILL